MHLPPESGVAIHHLSHCDVAAWIEKCNRYTSSPDRQRVTHDGRDLASFAHSRIDHWLARTKDRAPDGYPAAAAVLRAVYDVVDRLKTWEEERELKGSAEFARICAVMDADYAALLGAASRQGVLTRGCPTPPVSSEDAEHAALHARTVELRACCDASAAEATRSAIEMAHWVAEAARWATAAVYRAGEAVRLDAELSAAISRLDSVEQTLVAAQRRIEAIEGSTFWRATSGARRLADQAKRFARRC
jgi:hypothetical protein